MIDKYFNYSIIIDLVISGVASILFYFFISNAIIDLPSDDLIMSMTSDIANVAFTSAGFVLTFLTLFVSFKVSTKPIRKKKKETLEETYSRESLFNIFLSSDLYFETIRQLKNAVKELIVIALIGYTLKISIGGIYPEHLIFYCVFGLLIISMTLWRSLLVLSGVLKIDKKL